MAAFKSFILCLLLSTCLVCCRSKPAYKVDPETISDNVVVDTIPSTVTYEEVVIPAIPEDSVNRLPDDPPVNYQEPHVEVITVMPVLKPVRERLQALYVSQIGVKEKTGNNDGVQVERYLRSVGLGKGYAWCAAFLKWNFDSVRVPTKITAWAPTGHNGTNVVYINGKSTRTVRPGDTFTLWYASLKRIGHTGFADNEKGGWVETVEGNTNAEGSREGNQCARRKRLKNTLYSITSWIKD